MNTDHIIQLVLKAVALAMGFASNVLGFFPNIVDINTHITMLGIGLVTLAVASLMKGE